MVDTSQIARQGNKARQNAYKQLIEKHPEEFNDLLKKERVSMGLSEFPLSGGKKMDERTKLIRAAERAEMRAKELRERLNALSA